MADQVTRRGVLVGAVASAAALPLASAGRAASVHEVTIRRFVFAPEHLQVRVGDRIRWTNEDIAPHTATADGYGWDTGEILTGQSGEIVVEDGMESGYFCVFHPHMKGRIEIV